MLRDKGITASAAPLVNIEYPACPSLEYHNIQALLVTSKNGLRALAQSQYKGYFLQTALFAVGEGTALLAKTQGYTQVFQGNGTVQSLPDLIIEHCKTDSGSLFHLAGSVLAWDLKQDLEHRGFEVIAPVLYHAQPEKSFPEKVHTQLAMGQVYGVVLMSPRMASIFISLLEKEQLMHIIEKLHFYCLSEKVANTLQQKAENTRLTINTAEQPTLRSLLSLISIPTIKA